MWAHVVPQERVVLDHPALAERLYATLRARARSRASPRSDTSSAPTAGTSGHGAVAISRTDSRNSGLISPDGGSAPRIESIALVRSSEEELRIISSPSIPTVYRGPTKWCSMRPPYPRELRRLGPPEPGRRDAAQRSEERRA